MKCYIISLAIMNWIINIKMKDKPNRLSRHKKMYYNKRIL